MSLFLLPLSGEHILGSSSPLIKASERQAFESALSLLAAAEIQKAESQAAYDAAREAGFQQGLVDGQEAVTTEFVAQAADMARQVVAHSEKRQSDIAQAALAATKAILGAVEPQQLVPAMVDQVLGRIDNRNTVTILVHPMHGDALSRQFQDNSDIAITTDAAFGSTDCEIITADGRIVASLSVQIDTLAARWGVAPDVDT
jgi:flagellar biosynthesis/type III secretory pathway protein FliH